MTTDPHHLRQMQDLYSAMDDMAEFARRSTNPIRHETNMTQIQKPVKDRILAYLEDHGDATAETISIALKVRGGQVRTLLAKMRLTKQTEPVGLTPHLPHRRGQQQKIWSRVYHVEPETQDAKDILSMAILSRSDLEVAWWNSFQQTQPMQQGAQA